MKPLFGKMYLRPGELWKEYRVKRLRTANQRGYPVNSWEDTGDTVRGVLAEASSNDAERTKHLWDQDQHSLTHTLVVTGTANARKGDLLTHGNRSFYVLVNDNVGALDGASLIYLEERNDVK